jgi:hypothetical protein
MTDTQITFIGIAVICIAFLKAVRDAIAHSNVLCKFGYWFSKEASERAKYVFMIKHPWWSTGIKKMFVMNVIVMFLDCWHFAEFLLIVSYAVMAMIFNPNPIVGCIIWISISTLFNLFYNKIRAIKQ